MDDLTVTIESVSGCRWILQGLEKLMENVFQTSQIKIYGAEKSHSRGSTSQAFPINTQRS